MSERGGPHPLAVVTEVEHAKLEALRGVLAEVNRGLDHKPERNATAESSVLLPFAELTTTHFCRWVILERDPEDSGRAHLVFDSNFDGDLETYLRHLAAVAGRAFDAIYAHCVGYPGSTDVARFVAYLLEHRRQTQAFFVAYPGVTVARVHQARRVREAVQAWLDDHAAQCADLIDDDPRDLCRRLVQDLAARGIVPERAPASFAPTPLVRLWRLVTEGVPLLFLTLGQAFRHWRALRAAEDHDNAVLAAQKPLPMKIEQRIRELEDLRPVQNQLTHLVKIKPEEVRKASLPTFLRAVDFLAYRYFTEGELGHIPSIHCARWITLADDRLLFVSNYDGSWESYLSDFVDRAAWGLTGVWSNTVGYPRTTRLINEGAVDEEAFKAWVRNRQIPTQVWFSQHPESTVRNIRNDLWLEDQLARPLRRRAQARQLLARL